VIWLPELLQRAGYATIGITTNGHVARTWAFDRGFEMWMESWKEGLGLHPSGQEVNQLLFRQLERLREPFFLYVHYLDPHLPYEPAPSFLSVEERFELGNLTRFTKDQETRGLLRTGSAELLRRVRILYRGEVRQVDEAIRVLLEGLQRRGYLERSLILVTSDHGEELGERGKVGHGKTLFEEVIRVPLIFFGLGVRPGGALGTFPLESVVPTLLELLGVEANPIQGGFDGPSFAKAIRFGTSKPPVGPRLLYLEGDPDGEIALVDFPWKLSLHLTPYLKALYDLRADPGETRDRTLEAREEFERMAGLLVREHNRLSRLAYRREPVVADRELAEQLAALGYGNARSREIVPRAFPRRIRAADSRRGGLRGWEDPERFRSCGTFVEDSGRQLLMGWYGWSPGEAGRWSYPEATFGVKRLGGGGEGVLELSGWSYRLAACEVTVWVEEEVRWRGQVEPGPFELRVPLEGVESSRDWWLVRVQVEPPFVPQEHGVPDARVLGLQFAQYCVRERPR
jgi:hypothetical protein